jgi:hypothetical protein
MPLLDETEIARVRAAVHAERERWVRRHPTYPFFTLGTASYLDAGHGFGAYQDLAQQMNPVLHGHVGWVHDRLRDAVSALVGAEATFDDRLALPGFHVYLDAPDHPPIAASLHFDRQYELIDWREIGVPDIDQQLSLTLSITLPASGAGLLVWNVNRAAIEAMTPEDRQAHMAANRTATRHAYTPGHLVAHSGHQLHQIAPTTDPRPDDERITMQAHALPVDGKWVVYW